MAGITAGTLLFEDRAEANQYTGKAFVFSRKCGPRSYDVSGPLETSAAMATITLSGRRPIVDADCHPTGRFENDVLVFFQPSDTHQSAQKPEAEAKPIIAGPKTKTMQSLQGGDAIVRSLSVGGSGGSPFDDSSNNHHHVPITGIKIVTNLNPADHRQVVIGTLQAQWGDSTGPIHGGRGPLAQPASWIQFAPEEEIRNIIIHSVTFNFPASPPPVWVSGVRILTNKSSYEFGNLSSGSTSECAVPEGRVLLGFYGRSGSYIDQLGCLLGNAKN